LLSQHVRISFRAVGDRTQRQGRQQQLGTCNAQTEGITVIRQAISCDICGTEKRQTNHWFVAYEQAGELRIGGWTSRHRLRAGAKHLCGQTCLHKLVDEFMAKCMDPRPRRAAEPAEAEASLVGDTSLTSAAAYLELDASQKYGLRETAFPSSDLDADLRARTGEPESSARLLTSPVSFPARPAFPPQPDIVAVPSRPQPQEIPPSAVEPRYSSRTWHAEAWERERERELRTVDNRPDIAARRRAHA
jgi:hypothetical protein